MRPVFLGHTTHYHVSWYIHTCIHTYIHTYMHAYIHTYIHTYMHTYIVCMYACMYVCMYVCITYIHTYVHACIHTYFLETISRNQVCIHFKSINKTSNVSYRLLTWILGTCAFCAHSEFPKFFCSTVVQIYPNIWLSLYMGHSMSNQQGILGHLSTWCVCSTYVAHHPYQLLTAYIT